MNLDRAQDRAQSVKGPKSAAKLYADIEYELAMGEPNGDQEQQGEAALGTLEQRFPGVKSDADNVVENGHIPNMSQKGWHNTHGPDHEGRRRRGNPPAPARQRVQQNRQTRSSGRPASRSVSRAAGGAWDAASGTGWGQFVIWMFMAGLGLSIGYRLLTHPTGISKLAEGAANVTRAVVSTAVDPLNPSGPPRTAHLTRRK